MACHTVLLADQGATAELAAKLAPLLKASDCVMLEGELGSGKTSFARALLRALGIEDEVPSPTFTLLQVYEAKSFSVYHFDLYRLDNETELEELGWEDAVTDGLTVVEWGEKILTQPPIDRLLIRFSLEEKGVRLATITSFGSWQSRLPLSL